MSILENAVSAMLGSVGEGPFLLCRPTVRALSPPGTPKTIPKTGQSQGQRVIETRDWASPSGSDGASGIRNSGKVDIEESPRSAVYDERHTSSWGGGAVGARQEGVGLTEPDAGLNEETNVEVSNHLLTPGDEFLEEMLEGERNI
ncbi:MAG: hypothetical protein M1819_004063 [Sarea resinae]|nr:MAG: hypothetical protein M1819_004063 [Sarea resinae]